MARKIVLQSNGAQKDCTDLILRPTAIRFVPSLRCAAVAYERLGMLVQKTFDETF